MNKSTSQIQIQINTTALINQNMEKENTIFCIHLPRIHQTLVTCQKSVPLAPRKPAKHSQKMRTGKNRATETTESLPHTHTFLRVQLEHTAEPPIPNHQNSKRKKQKQKQNEEEEEETTDSVAERKREPRIHISPSFPLHRRRLWSSPPPPSRNERNERYELSFSFWRFNSTSLSPMARTRYARNQQRLNWIPVHFGREKMHTW